VEEKLASIGSDEAVDLAGLADFFVRRSVWIVGGDGEAFGAHGMMIKTPEEIVPIVNKAFDMAGPVIVGVPVDYTDNHKLFEMVKGDSIH
jgi:hypothetical protein